ncbi:hypothetical protein HYG77_38880 (plasmid) [Rhodococcus sp. ZPP]|uniref:hypothetical protein n=1 Tax=Rhodococcus sp. ZPP TaxID=2749906 RepID=UPI001AD85641|nr:hypothetical protein [Rhodococcus sp. ZPP]QTJ71400.1 hypothetical protein HYG77_38880 [Rhodococcus sp. ZPP]
MVRRGLLVALISALLMLVGGGVASALCAPPSGNSGGGTAAAPVDGASLPQGFPADLRQFVAGTDEFRAGPWFSGPCASKGGDLGAYINTAFGQEDRLLWWSDPENQNSGVEPAHGDLPRVFPYDDTAYKMPEGTCADDVKSWATPSSSNPWGFTWATEPDRASVDAMVASASERGDVPPQAWSTPCKMDGDKTGMFCAHAFFVDCSKTDGFNSSSQCQGWNRAVGTLFGGTANWINQNTSFADVLGDRFTSTDMFQAGKWVLNFDMALAKGVINAAGGMVDFAANPSGFAGKWANDFKAGAVDMSTKTLESMTCSHSFDPTAPWFRSLYATSMAFGFLVMAIMAVATVVRSGHKGSPKELAESLFQYLPISIFVATFVPGLAWFILSITEAGADVLAGFLGQSTGTIVANVNTFGGATADNFFGGAVGGMILFLGLVVAALMLWLGMQIHQYGMPLSLVAAGLSLFMLMHPKYRKKALAPLFVFLALALSVPVLFLLLAVIFGTANAVWGSEGDTAIGMASQVLFVALGMALAALAPWGLLKWAPVLPTRADSEDIGSPGPGVGSEIVGAAGNYMMYQRGGGGGGGVGGEQPAMRSDVGSQTATGLPGSSPDGGGQPGPMQAAYQERGDLSSAGQHSGSSGNGEIAGARAGVHGSGEAAGSAASAGGSGAASAGGTAAAGAATGGVATGVAVAAQAASAAITKAKSTADNAAETADDN